MQSHSPPTERGQLRTLRQLATETGRGTETVRRHIARGRIGSTKVGTVHAFTPAQWGAALAYFAQLDQLEEEERGRDG